MPILRNASDARAAHGTTPNLPTPTETSPAGQFMRLVQPFRHLVPFALVGVSGLLVNSTILASATHVLGLQWLMVSTVLSTLGSTLWNFTLTEGWVFRDRRRPGWPKRLGMFLIMNNAALLIRGPMIYALTFRLNLHYLLSNVLSIGTVTLVRYVFSDQLIWRTAPKRKAGPPPEEEKSLGQVS